MIDKVFVYGTLMFDKVINKIIHRVPLSKPAKLVGYRRHKVKGVLYPGIRPASTKDIVYGKIYLGITLKELKFLDDYEGCGYYRKTVDLQLECGNFIKADTYVFKDQSMLFEEDWCSKTFAEEYLNTYLS